MISVLFNIVPVIEYYCMVLSDKNYIIFAIILTLLGGGIFLFQPDQFGTTKPVGIAYFEKMDGEVRLKNESGESWSPVDKGALIQNLDIVQSFGESNSIIKLKNRDIQINLPGNSTIKLSFEEDRVFIEPRSGFVDIEVLDGKDIIVGKTLLKFDGASSVRIFKPLKSEGYINALAGNVEISRPDLDQEKNPPIVVPMGEHGLLESLKMPKVELYAKLPKHLHSFLPTEPQEFLWGADNVNLIFIQIAEDPDFENLVYEKRSFKETGTIQLEKPGTYYWRVVDEEGNKSYVKQITVNAIPAPKVHKPKMSETFKYVKGRNRIEFVWESEHKYGFEYEVTHLPTGKVTKQKYDRDKVFLKFAQPGRYKWRVRSAYPHSKWTQMMFFSIDYGKGSIAAISPQINFIKSLDKSDRFEKIKFEWDNSIEGPYQILISKRSDLRQPVLNQIIDENYLEFLPDMGGKYFWGIKSRKFRGIASSIRPFMVQQEVGEFLSPANQGIIYNLNSRNDLDFLVLRNTEDRVLLEISEEPDFKFNLYKIKLRDTRKKLQLKPGNYFARLSPLPGNDLDVWKERVISFSVSKPEGPEQPELPRYMQAFITNAKDVKKRRDPAQEKYFLTWPEVERAVRYQVTITNPLDKSIKSFSTKDPHLTLVGEHSESREFKVVAIDSWGRRSPASIISKLLFPIAPLTEFPEYLQNPENWDYDNFENIINQKFQNEFEDDLD